LVRILLPEYRSDFPKPENLIPDFCTYALASAIYRIGSISKLLAVYTFLRDLGIRIWTSQSRGTPPILRIMLGIVMECTAPGGMSH
jgi:hypothetical protein